MQRQMSNLGNWLVARSSLTATVVCQKMGLFNNMLFNRQVPDAKKVQPDQVCKIINLNTGLV